MPETVRPEVEAVLERALSQIGVRETGPNRGRQVEMYLASVDNPPGAPWCASFVYWAIQDGLQRRYPGIRAVPYVKSAYCPTVATWAEDLDLYTTRPERGDTFLLSYGGRARHTGIVLEVGTTRFFSCEGNTNLDGSAEGDGVYRRDRPRDPGYTFVRWRALLPPRPQAPPPPGTYTLFFGRREVADLPVLGGRAYCPVRLWGKEIRVPVAWDQDAQEVLLGGHPLPCPVTQIDGVSHAPLRALVSHAKKTLELDEARRRITIR